MAAATAEEKSSNFPPEIEAEILLWLPVKTLIRFKCVCKTWYSLIFSPQFQKDHFRRAQTKPPLLLTLHIEERDRDRDYSLTLRVKSYNKKKKEGTLTHVNNFSMTLSEEYSKPPFMQSCLGLVCISPGRYRNSPIRICNPSTHEFISSPPTKGSYACVGFGFATSVQEFKVVRIFSREDKYHCEVFTLGTTRWREGRTPPFPVFQGTAPFLHGALHFQPLIPWYHGVKDTDCIAVFDIVTEEYRKPIPLPTYYYSLGDCECRGIVRTRDFVRLTKLRGSLCLTLDFGEHRCYLELWVLKDYNNVEWVKGYTIDVSSLYPYPSYGFWAYPTDTMDDDILLNCYDDTGVKLLGYDPQDGTVTLKKDKEWAATFYVETLYPLKGQGLAKRKRNVCHGEQLI